MKAKLIPLAVVPVVIGASLAVAVGPLDGGERSPARTATNPPAPEPAPEPAQAPAQTSAEPRPAARLGSSPQAECTNLTLTPSARAELVPAPVKGTTYYGACEGHRWWMARFPDGSDGVFKDGPNGPIRIGSIEESRCDVPRRLLRIWQQAEACVAGAHERPAPLPDDPAPPTEQPAPPVEQPAPEPRPDDQPRYENGRTWIEQYNWCQILHAQGVPCTVPPPP